MKAALCTEVLYPLYGVERRVYEMAMRLPRYGFGTKVFTSSSQNNFPSLDVKQVSSRTITSPPKRNYISCIKYMRNLYSELVKKENEFNIIDANGHMSLIPCALAAEKAKIPSVATLHDLYLTEWRSMYRGKAAFFGLPFELISAKMHFDKMIVLNSSIKNKLIKLRIPEEKIEIIPSGIDTEELDSVNAAKKENEILFAGRLAPQKNVDMLLKAFSLLENNGIRLTVVGEGLEKSRLMKLAGNIGIKKRVNFVRPLERMEFIKRLKAATVFVMPSRRENFGIAPLESMYCKTATISTNTEGPRDYIINGKNGMLVGIGNAKQLAQTIELILTRKRLRQRLERNGNKTARTYDWNNIIKRIAVLYNELV